MSERTRVSRTAGWCCCSVFAAAGLLIAAGSSEARPEYQWKGGGAIALNELEAGDVPAKLRELAGRADARRVVVRFDRPLAAPERAALEARGLRLLNSVGGPAYFASLDAHADPAALNEVAAIRAVSAIDASWKTHPAFADGAGAPAHAIVRDAEGTGVPGDKVVGVYVMFHKDADINRGAALVESLGGEVRDWLLTINGLVVELPRSRVAALAAADLVQWVEPPIPLMSDLNAENRAVTQVNLVQAAPYSLNGSGVSAMIYDGGTARASHQDFGGRLTVRDSAGLINHSTHVAGTVGGSGAASGGNNRGMAPAVTLESYGLQNTSGGIFLYTNPGDLEADYTDAILNQGCDIANNSIGTNTAPNGFPCEIEGDYGITDVLIDSIARGATGAPFRIVWAGGNERQGSARCGSTYHTVAPPSNNKNAIVVGAINSNDLSITSFSSWGPSDDDRLKPDICAPGCQVGGDGGVTSTGSSSDSAYSVLCGTSMACPTVTGIGALIIQDYRALFPGQPDLLPATLKALLIHRAQDLGNPGPDYQYGYGNVQVRDTIDFMRTRNFVQGTLDQGGSFVVFVDAVVGNPLKFTLAWDDAPGTPNVIPSIVNDLDLVVTAPGGARHYPWTLGGLANPAANAVRTVEDHLNNVEQVVIDAPVTGQYRVEVRGTSVPQGPQTYALMGVPDLAPALSLTLVTPIPTRIDPGVQTDFDVQVFVANQTIVPGSTTFSYRFNPGDAFTTVPMSSLGGNMFRGALPAASCGQTPQFYFSVAGSVSGAITSPSTAPSAFHSTLVETLVTLADIDAEAGSTGWTMGAPGDTAITGQWTWGDPIGTTAQPENDHTPAPGVNCFFTGQGSVGGGAGEADVDGGYTTLISPAFDLSGVADATMSYWRWYSNNAGGSPGADVFRVDISNNNGASWINLETVGPTGAGTTGGWVQFTFQVAGVIPPTGQVRLRFVAEDAGAGSLIEAAVDDLRITAVTCQQTPACPGDVTGNGSVGLEDVAALITCWAQPASCNPAADLDASNDIGLGDMSVIINHWGEVCP